jgi:hypothetical protein
MRLRFILPVLATVLAVVAVAQEPPFKGGFPPTAAAEKARDTADYQRAITGYRFWYSTISCEGIFNGNREKGIKDNESIIVLSAGPRRLAFTANSDTPYGAGCLDLKDGPFVIEIPPGPSIGLANDHHQGWILDMGLPGPAADKGDEDNDHYHTVANPARGEKPGERGAGPPNQEGYRPGRKSAKRRQRKTGRDR